MKFIKNIVAFLILGIICSSFQTTKGDISVNISDKRGYQLVINSIKIPPNPTLNNFKNILGKPTRIIKQKKGKKKCSGLSGLCGTIMSIPKRTYIYYDKIGLKLIGLDKNEIYGINIFIDTTNLNNTTQGVFQGKLTINDSIINSKTLLEKINPIENKSIDLGSEYDPAGCHGKCKLLNSKFRPGFSWKSLELYELTNDKNNSKINLIYNKKIELVKVDYYKK